MKPAVLASRLSPLLSRLCCPRCQNAFALENNSLVCSQRHCFDLSRKGYVNLAPSHDQEAEKYGSELFESRRLVFEHGFYEPVARAIASRLPSDRSFLLLDAGCGEGYYARFLSNVFPLADILGVDLSRDAITAAARIQSRVADLKHLPLQNGSTDVLLDVLTPADYQEFSRVLSEDGQLIKVIPGRDYLCEVRRAVAPWLRSGADYDNSRVLEHLKENASILSEEEVRITRTLTPEESQAFLRMTPMTFSVPQEVLSTLSLSEITIHMHVVCCKMN